MSVRNTLIICAMPYYESLNQIMFFDEFQENTDIGRTGETVVSFPQNEDGLYDRKGRLQMST
jgi:hypothetical protein